MIPDASKHNPRPEYLRALLQQAGLSQRAAARRIGISDRVMRYYLAGESAGYRPASYPVQFALEALAQQLCQQPPRGGQAPGAGPPDHSTSRTHRSARPGISGRISGYTVPNTTGRAPSTE